MIQPLNIYWSVMNSVSERANEGRFGTASAVFIHEDYIAKALNMFFSS